MRLPDFVVSELKLNEILRPITSLLRTIMNNGREPEIRTHNVVFVPIGSKEQVKISRLIAN